MKETRKQIEAQMRNKLAKQYGERLKLANKREEEAWNSFDRVYEEAQRLREENEQLKEKLEQCEDWIRRLQDFCNMPEDLRNQEIENIKQKKETTEAIETFLSPFLRDLSTWFNY